MQKHYKTRATQRRPYCVIADSIQANGMSELWKLDLASYDYASKLCRQCKVVPQSVRQRIVGCSTLCLLNDSMVTSEEPSLPLLQVVAQSNANGRKCYLHRVISFKSQRDSYNSLGTLNAALEMCCNQSSTIDIPYTCKKSLVRQQADLFKGHFFWRQEYGFQRLWAGAKAKRRLQLCPVTILWCTHMYCRLYVIVHVARVASCMIHLRGEHLDAGRSLSFCSECIKQYQLASRHICWTAHSQWTAHRSKIGISSSHIKSARKGKVAR